jgi:hypothetical protein
MRATVFPSVLMLAALVAAGPASAQAKKDSKPAAAANETRYFTSISGIMDDQADTVLRETRSAGKVTGAVLDVCYPARPNSDRKDRFVATLTVDGNRLTGSTESIVGKQPVTIALSRKATPAGVNFDGKVTIGGSVSTIASTENSDISEKEFNAGQDADDEIMAAPADYTNASPEAIGVRVKPDDVANFVNKLRGQSVEIALGSLLPSCAELRRDQQVVHINIDPERAADFVARMKSEPGVVAAGWTSGQLDMDRTVRFDAADWRESGKVNKDKLAAAVSAILAKALAASALAPKWNDDTGELKLTFKRPNADLPALGLTQTLQFKAMVAADKPGANSDRLLLWLSFPTITTSDESTGSRLKIAESNDASAEDNAPADDGESLTAVARALKAQRWDADNSTWK